MAEQEAIEKIRQFIEYFSQNGCPPSGDCENYEVDDETNAVDCEMCLNGESGELKGSQTAIAFNSALRKLNKSTLVIG